MRGLDVAQFENHDIRDNGTGLHFHYAWTELEKRGVISSYKRYRSPAQRVGKHDFHVMVDDGRDDIPWTPPRPNGYYAIDTHLGYEARLRKARVFDLVWCAQKEGAAQMRRDGVQAEWLPLACTPLANPTAGEMVARGLAETIPGKVYDVAFVGYLQPPDKTDRIYFLDRIFRQFPNFRFAPGYFFEDMAKVYHQARVGINHSVRNDLNMRFFELASMGVPQACELLPELAELGFENGTHFAGYDENDDEVDLVRWLLDTPEKREQMANEAFKLVRERHTYCHRAETMLKQVQEQL